MESLVVEIGKILDEYVAEVNDTVEAEIDKISKEAVSRLKAASPKDRGEYARGWSSRKLADKTSVVYNRTHPGMTHLLERGHVIANQYGRTGGRAKAQPHIKPVEEWANRELLRRVEAKL